ncbi:VOC family protein [uncultured Psychroserpens sp.]|uniref:VOC family protein n=1 Tax=uncultured Psychroserpens sp. TaxID=255436 RepID=UPI00262A23B8|nr:VOC family protein [uncultured Psychroserpens sp.]
MKNTMKFILLLCISQTLAQTSNTIPEWFQKNMEGSIGTWVADNAEYQNENEPMTSYAMDWKWGIGKTSITGELYGYIDDKKVGPFWEFRQYWDFKKNEGILIQYGSDGTVGIGPLKQISDSETELTQIFTTPSGVSTTHGHRSSLKPNTLTVSSFTIDANEKWTVNRSYTWKLTKAKKTNDLGQLSLSLNVKDIKASYSFYKKLGFKKAEGNLDQNWVVLSDGNSKIGLFQGMFPNNTITFNPINARELYKVATSKNLPVVMKTGMDKKDGKASFMITDPDGNPILIDQHK